MKINSGLLLFSIGLFSSHIFSQGSGKAFGFAIQDGPALITSKIWISDYYAVDVAGTFNFQDGNNWVFLHSDFLVHNFITLNIQEGTMPLYWGGGIKVKFGDLYTLGLRAPLGASYIHKNSSFETFFEVSSN